MGSRFIKTLRETRSSRDTLTIPTSPTRTGMGYEAWAKASRRDARSHFSSNSCVRIGSLTPKFMYSRRVRRPAW